MRQDAIQNERDQPANLSNIPTPRFKTCPYCGCAKLTFNMEACIECGKQVRNITYVNNAECYAKNWYEYIGSKPKVEKLGIRESLDN